MTKDLKNLNRLERTEIVEGEKIVDKKEALPICNKSNEGVFESFFNSIEENKTDKKLILSEYLNKSEIILNNIKDIKITLEILKNNQSKISNKLQYKISQIILKKLYEQNYKDQEFYNSFLTDFGTIENINKSKIDINTLINKLKSYYKYNQNISISNGEIFSKFTNIYQYKKFAEQTPSNKEMILELLVIEFQNTIDNFYSKSGKRYENVENLLVPSGNLSKFLENADIEIEKLIQTKNELETTDSIDLDKRQELNEINKKIRNEYIAYFAQNEKTKNLAHILQKLIENNFNFGKLNPQEKTAIAQFDTTKDIDSSIIKTNLDEYKKFLQDLYDFSKNQHTINLGDKEIKLNIQKDFEIGEHINLQNIENIDELPFSFIINLDENTPEIIELLEDPKNIILSREISADGVISNYTTKNGTMRIGNNYLLDIGGVPIQAEVLEKLLNCKAEDLQKNLKKYNLEPLFAKGNYDNFSKFLANSEVKILKRSIKLDGKSTNKISQLFLLNQINSPKKLVKEDNELDELVLGYDKEINESREAPVECAKRLYEYLGNNVEIYDDYDNDSDEPPYFFGDDVYTEAESIYNNLDKEGKESFANEFRDICENDEDEKLGGLGLVIAEDILNMLDDNNTQPQTNTVEEIADTPEKAFEKEREKIKGKSDCKFENGTRLYIKTGLSELPPNDILDSFFVFEICNINGEPGNGTFGLKAIGNEIPLACPGKIYDGLPYEAERLSLLGKSGTMYKMPERNDTSRLGCIKRVQESTAAEKLTAFGEMEGQVQLKGNKFVDKDGNEVKYFNRVEDDIDIEQDENGNPSKAKQGKKISKYEIKGINTSKGTIKIASQFDGTDASTPGEVKDVKYQYENELTFEQFILLIESKKLKGYNQKQQEELETKYDIEKGDRLPTRGLFRWVSIGNFISIFKAQGKKIKDLWKENQKEQEEHLENYLLSEEGLNLYKYAGNILSLGGLFGDVKTAFTEAELDYYNNRDSRIWKKIDKRYKKFCDDPVYPAEYATRLKPILIRDSNIYRGGDKDRYMFAAAVLTMLKKEGPYPRDFKNKLGEGYWVESFLGKGHKTRFLNFYNKKKQEINGVKDMGYSSSVRMDRMEELNKMEFQYIISVIDGSAPYNSDDENTQKSIRSGKFKDELQANLDSYFNKHEEEKNKMNTFVSAEEAYLRTLGAGRFNKALPALERMCEKASTPGEIFRLKGYIISAMLMGCIDYNSAASTMKSFWKTARSMGFSPLCWVRDPNHPEKIERLLNGISEGDSKIQNFTDSTKFDIKNFTPPTIKGDYGKMNASILNYREKNGKQILKYIENPIYYDKESSTPANSINAKAKAKEYPNREIFGDIVKFHNDEDPGNINGNVNSINFIKVAPMTAKGNIMKKYMPMSGVYKTDKEEDLTDAKDARSAISKEIGQATTENVEYYMKFFLNLFIDRINKSELARTIALIEELKKRNLDEEAKYIRRYIFQGNMHKDRQGGFPDEFAHCFENFSKLFFNSIGTTIDKKVIKNAFGVQYLDDYKKPYKMINWKQWNAQMGGDDVLNRGGGKFSTNLRNMGFTQEETINYKIKELKKALRRYGVSFKKIPSTFETSDINLNFSYNEENNTYTATENHTPIPTT